MTSFRVYGSHGVLVVAAMSGRVLAYEPDGDTDYADICFFNVDEWRRAYPGEVPTVIDILDIGYWTLDGAYEPPVEDWRKEWRPPAAVQVAD